MKKIFFIFCIVSISAISCKKAVNDTQEYIGDWHAENQLCNITITIPESGNGRYYKLCDTVYVEASGIPYLKSKKSILKIGKKEFNITSEISSVLDSTFYVYQMGLDGIIYTRQ